jgi:hypothetical protein
MARTPEKDPTETVSLPVLGQEGDTCEQCGSALATDQRYCLNCGWRRGEARVDYERRLAPNGAQHAPNGALAAGRPRAAAQWSPVTAIGAIAVLGIMLLLGVLIGKDNNDQTQTVAAAAPATTTTAAAPTTPTTDTTAAAAKPKGGGGGAGTAPGEGDVVQGGSGSTEGIQTADTNKSVQENAKSGPDVVATQGPQAQLDPNGQAGGGSSATCIGC